MRKRTLSHTLQLLIALTILSTASIIGFIAGSQLNSSVNRGSERILSSTCSELGQTIENQLQQTQQAAQTLADYVTRSIPAPSLLQDPKFYAELRKDLDEMVSLTVTATPETTECAIHFDPDILPEDAACGIVQKRGPSSAQFFPVVSKNINAIRDNEDWRDIINVQMPLWQAPHADTAGERQIVLSYLVPVFSDRILVGYVSIDTDYDVLDQRLADIKVYDTGYAVLTDANGAVIHHPSMKSGTILYDDNPELARQYATRIVELRDGHITNDSAPFEPGPEEERRPAKPTRKTSMSFLTALGLSFNNLMTKKGRTLMTAFAGSIGIIGIAAILSLANGVNNYINNVEEETLSAYPVQISEQSVDMASMLSSASAERSDSSSDDSDSPDGTVGTTPMVSNMAANVGTNDTASLKEYLDGNGGGINSQVSAIDYQYNVTPQIFLADTTNGPVQVNPESSFSSLGMGSAGSSSMGMSTNVFSQLPGSLSLFEDQYNVKAGRWPESADELVLVLDSKGKLLDLLAYDMGLRDHGELEKMVNEFVSGEAVETDDTSATYTYDQLMSPTFSLVNASDMYSYEDSLGVWSDRSDDDEYMKSLVENGTKLHIVGVVQPKKGDRAHTLSSGIYYTKALTQQVIEAAKGSQIVQDQIANPDVDVFTGETFENEAAERCACLERVESGSLRPRPVVDGPLVHHRAPDGPLGTPTRHRRHPAAFG